MMPDTCNEVQLGENACAAFSPYAAELLLNLLGKLSFRSRHADLHGRSVGEGGREKLQQNQRVRLMVPPRTAIPSGVHRVLDRLPGALLDAGQLRSHRLVEISHPMPP